MVWGGSTIRPLRNVLVVSFFHLIIFSVVRERTSRGAKCKRGCLSFFLVRHFISELIMKAIWRALMARECFEKMRKALKNENVVRTWIRAREHLELEKLVFDSF